MNSYVRVTSITHATKGKNILMANGYKAYIRRLSQINETGGCGFVLVFNGDVEKVKALLEKSKIRVLGSGVL
ncbi:MAG: DUF3343 domain-containing protein [Clostridiales bacterium]|nr:DUF3343 domain-containing protein [Clostridiales bacterium]